MQGIIHRHSTTTVSHHHLSSSIFLILFLHIFFTAQETRYLIFQLTFLNETSSLQHRTIHSNNDFGKIAGEKGHRYPVLQDFKFKFNITDLEEPVDIKSGRADNKYVRYFSSLTLMYHDQCYRNIFISLSSDFTCKYWIPIRPLSFGLWARTHLH